MPTDYGQWLKRLGIKDGVQPPVARVVQPVQIVGDYSGVVSREVGKLAYSGGNQAAAVGEAPTFKFACRAPGRMKVTVSYSAQVTAYSVINNVDTALTGEVQNGFSGSADHPISRWSQGTDTSLGLGPSVRLLADTPFTWEFDIVRSGFFYYFQTVEQNIVGTFFAEWLEYPRPTGRDEDDENN